MLKAIRIILISFILKLSNNFYTMMVGYTSIYASLFRYLLYNGGRWTMHDWK